MKLGTFSVDDKTFYGAFTDAGAIALNEVFPQWATLYDQGFQRAARQSMECSACKTERQRRWKRIIFSPRPMFCDECSNERVCAAFDTEMKIRWLQGAIGEPISCKVWLKVFWLNHC